MAVYVDDGKARYGRMIMCHMLADTPAELHWMADTVGVKRKWFQGDHYDICQEKRAIAVFNGAKQVTRRQMIEIRTAFRRVHGQITGGK